MAHSIEELIETAMENIKEMVDVNTIISDPVETPDGKVILPISRVSFGFVAGGGEQNNRSEKKMGSSGDGQYPFTGGSGAGITLRPVAFLVVGGGEVRLLTVGGNMLIERAMDLVPQLVEHIEQFLCGAEGDDPQGGER